MAGAPPQYSNRRMWLTLFAMCFALFMIMLDNTVVNVALPTIQRDLDPSQSGLQQRLGSAAARGNHFNVDGCCHFFFVLLLLAVLLRN